jgi:hypothetical protein
MPRTFTLNRMGAKLSDAWDIGMEVLPAFHYGHSRLEVKLVKCVTARVRQWEGKAVKRIPLVFELTLVCAVELVPAEARFL